MTDKQQPPAVPERVWINPSQPKLAWTTYEYDHGIPYARVHPVDDARVEEIRARRQKAAALEARRGYNHPLERPTWADVDYLLSQLSSSEPTANLVSEIVDAVSHCGPLRKVVREETTYIFGFDVTKAMEVVSRILKRSFVSSSERRCGEYAEGFNDAARTLNSVANTGAGEGEQRGSWLPYVHETCPREIPVWLAFPSGKVEMLVLQTKPFFWYEERPTHYMKATLPASPVPVAKGEPQ